MSNTPRQFQCRDDLWLRVETLAARRGITPDQVVESALVRLFSKPKAPPAPSAPGPSSRPPAPPKPRPLFIHCQGEWHPVSPERYIIGRGVKHSDLTIRDANISRQHCEVVREGNHYYIRDLGSTNGIEFGGQRIDNHYINEGSLYSLCGHDLLFSYHPPQ